MSESQMTLEDLVSQYGCVIWKEVDRESDRERERLTGQIDAIIEAAGVAPYDWFDSGEGIEAYCLRWLPTQAAKDAAHIRVMELEEIGAYSRSVYELTMRRF